MSKSYQFLPVPRRISFGEGVFSLPESALIHIDSAQPQLLRSAADRLTTALVRYTGRSYTYAAVLWLGLLFSRPRLSGRMGERMYSNSRR